jgi:hypothetical protein
LVTVLVVAARRKKSAETNEEIQSDEESVVLNEMDDDVMIDLTPQTSKTEHEIPRMTKSQQKPIKKKNRKWSRTHGLAALPSKEELGYDETSMEIVDAAD